MSALTRILNNQITNSTIIASQKIAAGSITGSLFASNVTVPGDFLITGNLFVLGTSAYTTIASTNTFVNDPLIVLNNGFAGTNTYDEGFIFNRGSLQNRALIWSEYFQEFRLIGTTETGTAYGNVAVSNYANLHLGNLTVDYALTTGGLNTTGNVLATAGTFNALTVNGNGAVTGYLNVTGNVLASTIQGSFLTASTVAVGNISAVTIGNAGATVTGTAGTFGAVNSGFVGNTGTIFTGASINLSGNVVASTVLAQLVTADDATFGNVDAGFIGNTGTTFTGTTASFAGNVIGGLAQFAAINSTPIGNTAASSGAFSTLFASSQVTFSANTASTSTTTGALVVSGGVGVGGNITVGARFKSTDDTQSTSTTTGAIITAGGVGIAKNLTVGGDATITGNLTVQGVLTAIQSTTLDVTDLQITLARGAGTSSAADGAGINVDYGNVGANITYTHATTSWNFNRAVIGSTYANFGGNVLATNFVGGGVNISGNLLATTAVLNALTVNGDITSTGFFNTTANISAAVVNGGAINSTGLINTTGNVSAATVIAGQFNTTGNLVASEVSTGTLNATGTTTLVAVNSSGFINTTANVSAAVVNAGALNVTGTTTLAAVNSSGFIQTTGNVSASRINADTLAATGTIWANAATDTSSLSTGALIVAGGTAVGKTLWVGEGAVINSTRAAEAFQVYGATGNDGLIYADTAKSAIVFSSTGNTTVQNGVIAKFDSAGAIILPSGSNATRPGAAGNVDVAGMLRYSTTSNNVEFYDGTNWTAAGSQFTIIATNAFNGDGSTTAFTLSSASTTAGTIVMVNGVVQIPVTAYSVSTTTLTFTEAPATGDVIDARVLTTTATVSAISSGNGYNNFDVATPPYANITAGTSSATVRVSVDGVNGKVTFTNDVVINGQLTVLGDSSGNINIGNETGDRLQLRGKTVYDQTAINVPDANLKELDSFSVSAFTTARYTVQVKNGGSVSAAELIVSHDTATSNIATYAIISTLPGTFQSNISSGTVKLFYTPSGAQNANIKVLTTYIV
jgi:hypothetical protein